MLWPSRLRRDFSTLQPLDPAYSMYMGGRLALALVLNLRWYNTTAGGTGLGASPNVTAHRSRNYAFTHPSDTRSCDAISGITWDG